MTSFWCYLVRVWRVDDVIFFLTTWMTSFGDLWCGIGACDDVILGLHVVFVYYSTKPITGNPRDKSPIRGVHAPNPWRGILADKLPVYDYYYDVSAKESQFSSALYYKDTATQMDEAGALPSEKTINNVTGVTAGHQGQASTLAKESVKITVPGTGNQGFAKRSKFIQNSKQFVLSGPIFADIFMTDRLLLNMMDLRVVLNRSSNTFCLMDLSSGTTVKPKVQLSHVELKIRKVKLDQAVSDGIERMLKQTPALYPIRHVECKILTVPQNLPTTRQDNIFSGLIPKTFVVGFVTADAAGGVYGKNPYNFAHFGVTSLSLTANGEEIPSKQLTLKYPKDPDGKIDTTAGEDDALDFDEAYNTLFSGTGKIYSNAGLDIDRDDYPGGYALYAFDLTPDMCKSSQYFNTVQHGSLSLALTFKSQSEPLALVCYGDFENVIRIDAERNAIYDIS